VNSVFTRFDSIEEFCAAIGGDLGVSDWMLVDQARIDGFADATDDHQWIHVDPERAAAGPYGATIAHGYLTLSLLPALSRDVFSVGGVRMTINYGLDRVRFPQAVSVGSRLRARATLISADAEAAGTRAVVRFAVEIDGKDKPACVADSIRLLVP